MSKWKSNFVPVPTLNRECERLSHVLVRDVSDYLSFVDPKLQKRQITILHFKSHGRVNEKLLKDLSCRSRQALQHDVNNLLPMSS